MNSLLSAPRQPGHDVARVTRTRGTAGLPAVAVLLFALLCAPLVSRAQTWVENLTGMNGPTFVALDSRDGATWLYVSEHGVPGGTGGGRILKFNLTAGGPGTVIANAGTADGEFISPDAIVVDPATGDLFIADRFLDRVQRITNTGTFVMKFGSGAAGAPDEMQGPLGLARDAAGALYVTEHDSNFVSKYTLSGTTATRVWRLPSTTNTPYGIAVVGSLLYFSDGFNSRIVRWDLDGSPQGTFTIPDAAIPLGIFADADGALWIAEGSAAINDPGSVQRIAKRDGTGGSLGMTWGSQGTADGQFRLPFHAVVDAATNRAYVADYENDRVQVFDLGTLAPPVITSPLTATATAGAAFSYTISATNSPSSFSATGLPSGLAINTSTGVIAGTTSDAGTHNVSITATNGAGADTETLVLTVEAVPAQPVITSDLTASLEAGAAFDYTITATNSPTSYSATGLPTGLSVDTSTGQISGSTTVTGTHNVTIGATNAGGTGTATLVLTVSPAATPAPVIDSALTASVEAGAAFSYTISATNSPTSFAATGLPAGLSVEGTTGVISGSTTVVGSHDVTISATNAGGTGSATLVLTVTAAPVPPPVITSPLTASVEAGAAFTYTITATNSPTSFSATGLPAGLAVNASTGEITGSTTVTGSHDVTIGANNAGGSGSATLVLTVTAAPVAAPVIDSALTASVEAGAAFTYTITATNSPTSFGATSLPAGLSIDSSTGVISGSTSVTGSHDIVLSASNAGGTGTATLTLTVSATPIPPPAITSPLTASVDAEASFSYTITATNSPTSFSATGLPAGLSINTSTGVISGSTSVTGSHAITLGATNASGTGNATLTLTVNEPPVVVGPPAITSPLTATVDANASFSYTITATNSPTSFSATGLPAGLSVNATTGAITGTTSVTGTHDVTLGATNASGTGNATLTLTVNAPPVVIIDPPVITSSLTASVEAGASFSYTISATNSPTSFSASGLPAGLSVNTSTGVISGSTNVTGTHDIAIGASNAGGSDSETLVLTVNAAPPPPPPPPPPPRTPQTITFLPPVSTLFVGQPITLQADASSGLPVTFHLLSGDGAINNGVLTAHSEGNLVVRASQSGNSEYAAAFTDVTFTADRALDQQVYFGKLGGNDLAAAISADGRSGLLVTHHAETGEALVVHLAIALDGTFANVANSIGGSVSPSAADGAPHTAAANATRTFTGRLIDGTITGTVPELGASFSATLQPASGPTAPMMGAYTASAVGSATSDIHLVIGPNGQVYALVASPFSVSSGFGTIAADGTFSVETAPGVTVTGTAKATGGLTGTLHLGGATAALAGASADVRRDDRLINVSSRLRVTSGDGANAFISGFVIAGAAPKQVLIRGVGPTLAQQGVTDAMPNPRIVLYNSRGEVILENDDWGNDAAIAEAASRTGAFALPSGSLDAALIATLAPGPYTVQLVPAGGAGSGLIEVYDMNNIEAQTETPLVNISSRGFVGVGAEARLTAGFVVLGNAPKRILLRGVGPTLTSLDVPGALVDSQLVLQAQDGRLLAQNDDWGTPQAIDANQIPAAAAEISAIASQVGAFALPVGSKDAALVVTLMPGVYTASVTGASNVTGAALVEVYEIPNQ